MARIPKPWKRETTGTWHVQIDGKQVYLGTNKSKAWAKYNRLMAGHNGESGTATVRQILLAYMEWLKSNRAPETVASRARIIKAFGDFVPASLRAAAVKPFHVQQWIDANSKVKVRRKNKTTGEIREFVLRDKSPTTANTRITLIIAVFSWAKQMGYIASNPLAEMPKPERKVRQEFLPVDTWQKVLELATDQPFREFLFVMLTTGARPQEMFKFTAEHFDVNGQRLILPIEDSKGKRKSRVVYLPHEALPIVQRLAAQYPEGKLFRNRKGKAFDRNSIRCRFRRIKRELGIPGLTATTLRHSYTHWRLTSGQDSLTVAKLLGHVDTRMIATRYGHLEQNPQFMQDAANALSFPMPLDIPPGQTV